jgi:hypothetical protein
MPTYVCTYTPSLLFLKSEHKETSTRDPVTIQLAERPDRGSKLNGDCALVENRAQYLCAVIDFEVGLPFSLNTGKWSNGRIELKLCSSRPSLRDLVFHPLCKPSNSCNLAEAVNHPVILSYGDGT